MNWFLLPAAPSIQVGFSLAGGLTGIALAAAFIPAVLALRAALGRRWEIRSAANRSSSVRDGRMTRFPGGARRRAVAFLHRVG